MKDEQTPALMNDDALVAPGAKEADAFLLDMFPEWDWDQRQCIASMITDAVRPAIEAAARDDMSEELRTAGLAAFKELIAYDELPHDIGKIAMMTAKAGAYFDAANVIERGEHRESGDG